MGDVRILIVDDEENWLSSLPDLLLKRLDPGLKIDMAADYSKALQKVKSKNYDLVSVDLELPGDINSSTNPDLQIGLDLLKECRSSTRNRACGLLVLSGRATPNAAYKARDSYGINVFLDKHDFGDGGPYVAAVQTAIRRARLQQAEQRLENRYQLTLTYSQNGLLRGDLGGPRPPSEADASGPPSIDLDDLARRADDLNQRLRSREEGAWRSEAKSIGTAVYQTIAGQQRILSLLDEARFAASQPDSSLSLRYSGPPSCLSVPFELVRDEGDYFALTHVLTRRLSQGGHRFTQKPDQFFRFIEKQVEKEDALRILIAGADAGGHLPAVEKEVAALEDSINAAMKILGIPCEVTPLLGSDVSYNRLKEALREGHHIFHFAGHGDFDESLPERSPLILRDRDLTAADLQALTQGTELRFVFLNCCLAARTARQVGRGDFHGFLHALSRADVPNALANRWKVRDASAIELATAFYEVLWNSFCFGQALLDSRRDMALGKDGRDNETWAAPVLLSQVI